jgi:hypothetical protein
MPLFQPTQVFRRATDITPAYLQAHGIRALILDVDNTLTGHGSQELSPEVAAWLDTMRSANVAMAICSNNYKKRVAPFASRLGLPFCSLCCKPAPWGLARARRILGAKKGEIALVGDQIFTDTLGANLYGIPMLLVLPMYEDIKPLIRFRRRIERVILQNYRKKGGIVIGEAEAAQAE